MPYEWKKNAEGNQRAERVPAGTHDLTIVKLVFGSKDGGPFIAGDGSPKIMVIFGDNQDREVSQMYTLSEKAAWKLAQLADAIGINLERMTADGVTPEKFAEPPFAEVQLMGRTVRAEVKYETKDNGKENIDVTPLRRRPGQGVPQRADDIPI